MRNDALGLFWEDKPVIKEKKEAPPKRTPPEPVWLRPDYLPNLEEARQLKINEMTDDDLIKAFYDREPLLFDVECYENYFLVGFQSAVTGKVLYFELCEEFDIYLDVRKLEWVMRHFCIVGFNSISYDVPIISLAVNGATPSQMMWASREIIECNERPRDVLKKLKCKLLDNLDHIDLIEVAPLQASLKIYGGRLHTKRMQDLPFPVGSILNQDQIAIVLWYNLNDLSQTADLREALLEQLDLRKKLSDEYGIDLRSKSDAQIAEAVICEEVWKLNGGQKPFRPLIPPGTSFYYRVPHYIVFQTPLMNWVLNVVRSSAIFVDENGAVAMPDSIKQLKFTIANTTYQMGIGGLHSCESKMAHLASDEYILVDRDVASYYPMIILTQGLYPQHLGQAFLRVYAQLVQRRLDAKEAAKAAGKAADLTDDKDLKKVHKLSEKSHKVVADSLKITINGSFGKLGSPYSVLYAPDLLIQVTLTGQLALLLLIETLELAGINVVSANTDGIVIKCHVSLQPTLDMIIKWWEKATGFETEETQYLALFSRDVNNYIAVKRELDKKTKTYTRNPDGVKTKGAYSNPWADPKMAIFRMHKNPTNTICIEAVEALLLKGTPLTQTIRNSKDIKKFVSVRKVKGGAVKDGQFLGKSIRWYYATSVTGEIVMANSGNKVPRSDGAKPLMLLPQEFPEDVDFEWYENEANKILKEIAYL